MKFKFACKGLIICQSSCQWICTVDYQYVVVGACYFNDKSVWLFVPNECVNCLFKDLYMLSTLG